MYEHQKAPTFSFLVIQSLVAWLSRQRQAVYIPTNADDVFLSRMAARLSVFLFSVLGLTSK